MKNASANSIDVRSTSDPPIRVRNRVEIFDPGRDHQQRRGEGEVLVGHPAGGEHVVRPDRHRKRGEGHDRGHEWDVAEPALVRAHGDRLGCRPEVGEEHHVDDRVAEEPEQVLVVDRPVETGEDMATRAGRCRAAAMARISTGKAPTTMSMLASSVQVNTGIRSSDMPGARRRAIVATTQAAMRSIPIAASSTPAVHRSWPDAGRVRRRWTAACRQTSRPAPVRSPVNQPLCMISPPAKPRPEPGQRDPRTGNADRPDLQRHQIQRRARSPSA